MGMSDCKNLAGCPFVKFCNDNPEKCHAVNGFILMYCKGNRMESCVRKGLCEKFGKEVVPVNMMPNGYPLPGSKKDGWSKEAMNYQTLL
jgi:hypothetical protein